MGIIFVVGQIYKERYQHNKMDKNLSIISIPDSETSACGAGLNETYSPPKARSSVTTGLLPLTPKREVDTTMNATFSPEENKDASKIQDGTFSSVKISEELPVVAKSRMSRTPRKLPEITVTDTKVDTPVVLPRALPVINVVPATPDTRTLRRSMRTPAKIEPVVTRASSRRSTRSQQQTPMKAVPAKKSRGRKSKKEAEDDTATEEQPDAKETIRQDHGTEMEAPIPTDTTKTENGPSVDDKIKTSEEKETKGEELIEDHHEIIKEDTAIEAVPVPIIVVDQVPPVEDSDVPEVKIGDEQPIDDAVENLEDIEPMIEDEDPFEESQDFHAPMLTSDAEVLLKSIRKRSLSVTDMNPPLPKRNFRVQFHSPGNMEKTITEIDESLYLNFTKSFASSFSIPAVPSATTESAVKKKNPPARRKRSLSNAETTIDKLATMQFLSDKHQKEKEKPSSGSAAKKMPTPSPRKKMPNFAAIHQNIFQQMESLVDFKERKKERAQFLLTASAQTPSKSAATIVKPSIAKPGRLYFVLFYPLISLENFS